jgi:hypothetical protein
VRVGGQQNRSMLSETRLVVKERNWSGLTVNASSVLVVNASSVFVVNASSVLVVMFIFLCCCGFGDVNVRGRKEARADLLIIWEQRKNDRRLAMLALHISQSAFGLIKRGSQIRLPNSCSPGWSPGVTGRKRAHLNRQGPSFIQREPRQRRPTTGASSFKPPPARCTLSPAKDVGARAAASLTALFGAGAQSRHATRGRSVGDYYGIWELHRVIRIRAVWRAVRRQAPLIARVSQRGLTSIWRLPSVTRRAPQKSCEGRACLYSLALYLSWSEHTRAPSLFRERAISLPRTCDASSANMRRHLWLNLWFGVSAIQAISERA